MKFVVSTGRPPRVAAPRCALAAPANRSPFSLQILVALVAAVSADYHDDTFHFSTLGSSSGLKKTAFLQAGPSAVLTKKVTSYSAPAVTQQFAALHTSPVFVSHAQPAPVLVKSIEQEIPVYTQHIAHHIAQPVYTQKEYTVKQVSQPAVFAQTHYTASHAAAAAPHPQIRILSQVQEVDPSGPYKLAYSTENGIQVQEEGSLIAGAEGGVIAAQGSYSYTGPDGVQYTVNYIADDNGFRASGDHLPTPPPIPAEILKSLEENAASGEQYDDQGRLLKK
ncbi:hypothetical protein ONE63_006436 [Megalurothrips usitatus]|uniref:Endocuticle structural glycoprotein SgAbd-2-like n=1 Tax=Megalurothrips usitatus TaxID=439358 RepID=A0AAV7Y0A5_9NEOP|nr:hypothetical protein ONE63_006436 [Megalurothrips usitatus]